MARRNRAGKLAFSIWMLVALLMVAGCTAPTQARQADANVERLLALRVPGYEELTVQAFGEAVREAREGTPGFMEAYYEVMENLTYEPEVYGLDAGDRRFITITLKCALDELLAEQQAGWSGEPVEPAYIRVIDLYRNEDGVEHHLFMDYTIAYAVEAPDVLTVGERDEAIEAIVGPLAAYLETEAIQALTDGGALPPLAGGEGGPLRPTAKINTLMVDGTAVIV